MSGHVALDRAESTLGQARPPVIVRNIHMGVNARRKQPAMTCRGSTCQEVHTGVDFFHMADHPDARSEA